MNQNLQWLPSLPHSSLPSTLLFQITCQTATLNNLQSSYSLFPFSAHLYRITAQLVLVFPSSIGTSPITKSQDLLLYTHGWCLSLSLLPPFLPLFLSQQKLVFQRAHLAGEREKGRRKKGEWKERKIDALSIPKRWLNQLYKKLNTDNTTGRWERLAVRVCFLAMLLCKLCMPLNTFDIVHVQPHFLFIRSKSF